MSSRRDEITAHKERGEIRPAQTPPPISIVVATMTTTTAQTRTASSTSAAAATNPSPPRLASVVTISYKDLVDFELQLGQHTQQRQQHLIDSIGEAFGRDGLGILAVTGVPEFGPCRRELLPLASKLAELPPRALDACVNAESLYSVGWSHGKEQYAPGKYDTAKGSFYANPLTDNLLQSLLERDGNGDVGERKRQYWTEQASQHPEFYAPNVFPDEESLPGLKPAFYRTGQLLATVGRKVAAVCDAYYDSVVGAQEQQQGSADGDVRQGGRHRLNLQETLTRSLNAKGRLLHYFAAGPSSSPSSRQASSTSGKDGDEKKEHAAADDVKDDESEKEVEEEEMLWCGWHNDHGTCFWLLFILVASDGAVFVSSSSHAVSCTVDNHRFFNGASPGHVPGRERARMRPASGRRFGAVHTGPFGRSRPREAPPGRGRVPNRGSQPNPIRWRIAGHSSRGPDVGAVLIVVIDRRRHQGEFRPVYGAGIRRPAGRSSEQDLGGLPRSRRCALTVVGHPSQTSLETGPDLWGLPFGDRRRVHPHLY